MSGSFDTKTQSSGCDLGRGGRVLTELVMPKTEDGKK